MNKRIFLSLMLVVVTGCSSTGSRNADREMAKYEAAATAYKNGELSIAEERYRQLVEQRPEYGEGWFKLGNIYVRTGQYDAAANMYKKAAQINPEDAKVWNNLALAHIKKAVAVLDEGARRVQQGGADQRNILVLRERIVKSVLVE